MFTKIKDLRALREFLSNGWRLSFDIVRIVRLDLWFDLWYRELYRKLMFLVWVFKVRIKSCVM